MKFAGLNLDFSIAKARTVLGYDPKVGFDEGMKRALDWYKQSSPKEQAVCRLLRKRHTECATTLQPGRWWAVRRPGTIGPVAHPRPAFPEESAPMPVRSCWRPWSCCPRPSPCPPFSRPPRGQTGQGEGTTRAAEEGRADPAGEAQTPDGPPEFEAKFADDSVLKVIALESALTVSTKYGKLTVPLADVVRLEVGFRYPEGIEAKVEQAIERWGRRPSASGRRPRRRCPNSPSMPSRP